MAYTKGYPLWKDDPDHTTPIVAAKLNNFETGISDAHTELVALDTRLDAEEAQPNVPAVVNGSWIKGVGGALVWSSIVIADVAGLQALLDAKAVAANAVLDGDAAGGVLAGTFPAPGFAQDMATQAELDTAQATVQGNLDTHIVASPAHMAAMIGFTPVGTLGSTNVQAAIAEAAAEGGGGGGGGVSYLSDLFDVTGAPPAIGEAPVWDGDTYELTDVVTAAELAVAIGGIDMSAKVDKDAVEAAAARLVAVKLLAGDAQPAFRIKGGGGLEWGAGGASALDVNLYRHAADILRTDDRILVARSVVGDIAYDARIAPGGVLDAAARFQMQADGKMLWGDGATALDVNLFRGSADVLQTDDELRVGGMVRGLGPTVAFVANNPSFLGYQMYGAAGLTLMRNLLVSTDSQPSFRVMASGAMDWGVGGSTAPDVNLYRSAANVLKSDDKFDPASLNVQVKAGVPVDGDIVGGAADGDMVWDTTGKKMYVRSGGVWTVAGGGGAWSIVFTALANEPPASGFATLDTRNSHAVLDFDAGTGEYALFRGVLPAGYGGGGVNVKLIWAATSAVTGNVSWYAAFERIAAGAQDIDSDSFGPSVSGVATCDTVSGETTETTIAVSSGANMDSLAAGEMFRLKVLRGAADGADTMAGDAELLAVVITEQ